MHQPEDQSYLARNVDNFGQAVSSVDRMRDYFHREQCPETIGHLE